MTQQIKQVEGHPNYWVSTDGNVYSKHGDDYYRLQKDIVGNGHARVTLDGRKYYVSSLVMAAFEPCEDLTKKIFHIEDRSDDSLSNLIWLTKSEIQRYSPYTSEYRKQLLAQ